MIELMTFRLRAGVDETDFLALDQRVQTIFRYQQPGLVRSTTARGDGGRWLVLQIWSDHAAADTAARAWSDSAIGSEFRDLLDESSVATERFVALD